VFLSKERERVPTKNKINCMIGNFWTGSSISGIETNIFVLGRIEYFFNLAFAVWQYIHIEILSP
jgi:hypothetical protein